MGSIENTGHPIGIHYWMVEKLTPRLNIHISSSGGVQGGGGGGDFSRGSGDIIN